MLYVGIDPGFDGSIAFLWANISSDFYDLSDVTIKIVTKQGKKKKTRKEYDLDKLVMLLKSISFSGPKDIKVGLEKVHSMPKQGVTSTFSFGRGYGQIEGILTALDIEFTTIPSQTWKKALGVTKDKLTSYDKCVEIFPNIERQLRGPRGGLLDGRAEALLIAEYIRRKDLGEL